MAVQTLDINKKSLVSLVEQLPDKLILKVTEYIKEEMEREAAEEERRYQSMSVEEIHAEIDALHEKYGMTPNARTIAAIKEVEDGLTKKLPSKN